MLTLATPSVRGCWWSLAPLSSVDVMATEGKAPVAAAAAALPAGATPAAATATGNAAGATSAAATATATAEAATTPNDDGVFDHLLPAGCLLRQFFEPDSSTYTYLVGDTGGDGGHPPTAVLIDPVDLTAERDAAAATAAGVRVSHAINTHVHADHVTGTGVLKRELTPPPLSVLSVASGGAADVHAPPGWVLRVGRLRLTTVATPGHTAGCQSLLLSVDARGTGGEEGGGEGDAAAATARAADPVAVFTGDALLIGGCGRTDFQGGDAATLYRCVRGLLTALPPATVVLPAHDYKARRASTVGDERASNARLRDGISEAAFVELMAALRLPMPRRIDEAVPANLRCGS